METTSEWMTCEQILVPSVYQHSILRTTHEISSAGHLWIKTSKRIFRYFYWPRVKKDIVKFCRICYVCQMLRKQNEKIPAAPLQPNQVFEVIVDCVGSLPKTKSSNKYFLTIICASSRFPEAITLHNISAKKVVKALINFFIKVFLCKVIQSDQGSTFMSRLFR